MIRIRSSLARQVGVGLVVYGLLLSAALFTHGLMVNEHAERMLWQAMLDTEMDIIFARLRDDPGHAWSNNGKLDLYRFDAGAQVPPEVSVLPPGLHDEVRFNDNEWVVLVRD
ncbi:MAG TPA: sensor histidine kinase, partial [Chiayiivirga sp.]|nr:sensor histidine kinase [Chiayiivirga sp.]